MGCWKLASHVWRDDKPGKAIAVAKSDNKIAIFMIKVNCRIIWERITTGNSLVMC